MPYKDHTVKPVRASAILTGAYVAGTLLRDCHEYDQLELQVAFTKGNLTSAELKVEFSDDNQTFHQETAGNYDSTTGISSEGPVTHQFTADGNYYLSIPLKARYVKVSVKGTTASDYANSLIAVKAVLAVV